MTRFLDRPWYRVIAALLCVSLVSPAAAQITEGKTAFDTLRLAGQRAPGALVADGVSRAQQRIQLPFGGTDATGPAITATERPQSRSGALSDSIDGFLDTLIDSLLAAFVAELTKVFTNLIASLFTGELFTLDSSTSDSLTGTGNTTTPADTTTPGDTATPDDVTTPDDTTSTDDARDDTGGGRGERRTRADRQ